MATEAKSVKRPPASGSSSAAAAAAAAPARGGGDSKGNNNVLSKSQSRPPIADEKRKIESLVPKRPVDSKMKSLVGISVSKAEVKSKLETGTLTTSTTTSKTTTTTSKTTSTSTTTKTRMKEKKVYTLAGQKFDPPEEREPLRIFYESLSKQIPTSEMAEFWMMEHGLLSPERSKKAFEKKQRKQKQIRMGTPVKLTLPSKPESSQRQHQASNSKNGDNKAKKKAVMDSDDDDDFILSPKRRKN